MEMKKKIRVTHAPNKFKDNLLVSSSIIKTCLIKKEMKETSKHDTTTRCLPSNYLRDLRWSWSRTVLIRKHTSWSLENQRSSMSLQRASWPSCFLSQLSCYHSSQSYHKVSSSSNFLFSISSSSPSSPVPSSSWPATTLKHLLATKKQLSAPFRKTQKAIKK